MMDDYCNGCGAEDKPLTQTSEGRATCEDCRLVDYWYGVAS